MSVSTFRSSELSEQSDSNVKTQTKFVLRSNPADEAARQLSRRIRSAVPPYQFTPISFWSNMDLATLDVVGAGERRLMGF